MAAAQSAWSPMTESNRLAELSLAVRDSTLKRLRRVPPGAENWRPSARSLSFADIAHHLLNADSWLFEKLVNPSLERMVAHAGEAGDTDGPRFLDLVERLENSGRERAARLAEMSQSQLETLVPDERFGGEVSVWWIVVRGNLDHEAHHRGQLATFLRILEDRGQQCGS
ncbi:MAG TPA: DinB family protein [Thermoanaerobaculia bacterium]